MPRRNPEVVTRELASGEMVVRVGDAKAVVLNEVGSAVWHLIDGERNVAAISAYVASYFPDAPPAVIATDVSALLAQLVLHGAISA